MFCGLVDPQTWDVSTVSRVPTTPFLSVPYGAESFFVSVPLQHGLRRYRLEIESTKTVLVDCS